MAEPTLFDEASLALIASGGAGKDGKVYSIKPAPEYGPELVTNGDFATDSDWNKEASWSISGGTANYSGVSNAIITQINLLPQSASATLKVQWTQTITSGTRLRFFARNYNDSSSSGITVVSVETTGDATYQSGNCNFSGTFTAIVTTTDGFSFKMVGETGNVGSIDNVSVQEVLKPSGDFLFSRGSNLSATRVGPDGLIEKGRENLLLQSNQFDTTWGKSNSSVTGGQSGYDGTNDAWLLNKLTTGGYIIQNIYSVTGVSTFSCYAKANSLNYIRLDIGKDTGYSISYFDLTGEGSVGSSGNSISSSIQNVGNGWYRCSVSVQGNTYSGALLIPADTISSVSTTGSVYIQDAQVEVGLAATEPIESGASTGKAGLLENEPRFDYSGGVTCPSLLKEKPRTNLIPYSEYITSVNNGSTSYNATESPEGLLNAPIFTATSTDPFVRSGNFSITTGSTYTMSFYIKGFGTSIGKTCATSTTTLGGTTFILTDSWQRISYSGVSTSTRTNAQLRVDAPNLGAVVGEQFSVWGMQVEQGSHPTSYIPNHSGGTISRSGELANYVTVGGGSEKWSLMYEFDFNKTPLQQNEIFSTIRNTATNVAMTFRHFTIDSVKHVVSPYFNLDAAYAFGSGSVSNITDSSVLLRANGDGSYDYFTSLNGGVTKTSVTGMTNIAFERIDLGAGASSAHKKVILFANTLSDTECIKLITI